jgi:aminoglycoside phosphotransferase family enzyme/predicted kinase
MELLSIINSLSDPRAYTGAVDKIEVRQTHISVVFLAGDFAYKIRKPVKFAFLDFSSRSQRRLDCQREVDLNQRLAPDVYLGIVPIVLRDGRLQVEGVGETVEWAVKMRRLPDECTLKFRLAHDSVGKDVMTMLARRLASFHATAAFGSEIAQFGRYEAVAKHVLENLEVGDSDRNATIERGLFERLTNLTRQKLEDVRDVIERRAKKLIPRDTHGDLRLDHIYLFPDQLPPGNLCIIDCIEFNDGFRYADPISDIAFLIMDLKFYGRAVLAEILISEYFDASGDEEGRLVLALYTSYRSAVRAKVALLESTEPEIPEHKRLVALEHARAHWLLALNELEAPSRRICLLLVGGLQGTGKSTLARELAGLGGFSVIRTDVVRKELARAAGLMSNDENDQSNIYTVEWTERTYSECLRRTVDLLKKGQRVIVDGTFSCEKYRTQFLDAAKHLAVASLFFKCVAEPEVIRRRLDERTGDASDADWNVYLDSVTKWEPESSRTFRETRLIESSQSVQVTTEAAANVLRRAALLDLLSDETGTN